MWEMHAQDAGLKHRWPQGREGSIPSSGTTTQAHDLASVASLTADETADGDRCGGGR